MRVLRNDETVERVSKLVSKIFIMSHQPCKLIGGVDCRHLHLAGGRRGVAAVSAPHQDLLLRPRSENRTPVPGLSGLRNPAGVAATDELHDPSVSDQRE